MSAENVFKKIIAAGHICIDITPVFPSEKHSELKEVLSPGKMIRLSGADIHVGGSAANTGLALKILGNDVTILGKVGNDAFGKMIIDAVAEYGVTGLLVDESCSSSYSVILAVPGIDRIILHDPGANDTYGNRDIPDEALLDAQLFHFGYPPLMRKMYVDGGDELRSIFMRVKGQGIATSLDMAALDPNAENGRADWRMILKKVLPYVDIFVPSFEETLFMMDREKYDRMTMDGSDITEKLSMEEDVAPLARELLSMGAKIVLLKCGQAGMYYKTAGEEELREIGQRLSVNVKEWADRSGIQPIFHVDEVKSGTGAGDTSIAAFLTGIVNGKTPGECARLAAAEGACCVTAYDALSGLKDLKGLEEMIKGAE